MVLSESPEIGDVLQVQQKVHPVSVYYGTDYLTNVGQSKMVGKAISSMSSSLGAHV